MTQKLPEVREENASAAVRAIYADIKQATGIPYVNLIFRHLALHPEVLAWAWDAVGPLYRDGQIASAVARLEVALPTPNDPAAEPIWSEFAEGDAEQIKAVLAFYNRGNPANLVGLTTLVAAARGQSTTAPAPSEAAPAPAREPDEGVARIRIPPLPLPEQIDPEALALARELAARQGGAEIGVVPSLYLHISLWPDAMAAAHRLALPAVSAVDWPQRVQGTIAAAKVQASELAAAVRVVDARPPAEILDGYIKTVDKFTKASIPEMVLIGRILAGGR
jgi:hypothetical protein